MTHPPRVIVDSADSSILRVYYKSEQDQQSHTPYSIATLPTTLETLIPKADFKKMIRDLEQRFSRDFLDNKQFEDLEKSILGNERFREMYNLRFRTDFQPFIDEWKEKVKNNVEGAPNPSLTKKVVLLAHYDISNQEIQNDEKLYHKVNFFKDVLRELRRNTLTDNQERARKLRNEQTERARRLRNEQNQTQTCRCSIMWSWDLVWSPELMSPEMGRRCFDVPGSHLELRDIVLKRVVVSASRIWKFWTICGCRNLSTMILLTIEYLLIAEYSIVCLEKLNLQ